MLGKDRDHVLRSRAVQRAQWLIRDFGDGAEEELARLLARRNVGENDRKLYRLIRTELAELRRRQIRQEGRQIAVRHDGMFGRMLSALGLRASRRRR